MSAVNFAHSLALVLKHEGGFVNHPRDPGGATNYGVTQRVYDAFRRQRNMPAVSVRHITGAERDVIYRREYWDRCAGDALPAGLDYPTFDGSVNSGVSRGSKWLQGALGVKADGKIGMKTLAAANGTLERTVVIRAMCQARMGFLHRLSNWKTFGRGWTRRVAGVEVEATKMALEAVSMSQEKIVRHLGTNGKAAQRQAQKDSAAGGSAGAGGTAAGYGAAPVGDPVMDPAVATPGALDPALMDQLLPWILGGLALVAITSAVVYLVRAYGNQARAAAYAAKINQLVQAL